MEAAHRMMSLARSWLPEECHVATPGALGIALIASPENTHVRRTYTSLGPRVETRSFRPGSDTMLGTAFREMHSVTAARASEPAESFRVRTRASRLSVCSAS